MQYHERILDFKSLAALDRAALAKALPCATPMSQRFVDLFAKLVPVAVSQAMAAYDVRRMELVNGEIGRLREHTQLLNGYAEIVGNRVIDDSAFSRR